MGNCHPCRMDADQVVAYWSKKNRKERAKQERKSKHKKSISSKNDSF